MQCKEAGQINVIVALNRPKSNLLTLSEMEKEIF
jgi:hypothetical protein